MGASVREQTIPWGDGGSYATIARMREIIRAGIRSPRVVETANRIAIQFPPRAHVQIAQGIRDWLRERFSFVRDPHGVELVRTPEYLLQRYEITNRIIGDCDDAAVMGCALAMSVGIPCKLVTLAFNKSNVLSHVYGVMLPPFRGKCVAIPFDVTRPPNVTAQVRRRLEFSV